MVLLKTAVNMAHTINKVTQNYVYCKICWYPETTEQDLVLFVINNLCHRKMSNQTYSDYSKNCSASRENCIEHKLQQVLLHTQFVFQQLLILFVEWVK